jgi:Ca2+-transporting ATPase
VQILYVNLATDGLPALALAVDPPDPDLMRRRPRDPRTGVFTGRVVTLLLAGGLWSAFANLALFIGLRALGRPLEEAMALTFVSLVVIQLMKAYNYRSDRISVFDQPFANRWLNAAVIWEVGLLLALVYVPALHAPFGTFAFSGLDWLLAGAAAATVVPVLEAVKWWGRRQDAA